jgi:Flp pilus assembly protein TadG
MDSGSCPRRCQRGAIAVEFALVALIIVPLIVGVVEFGRALYAYDTLTKAARSSARYLAARRPGDATDQAEARCIALTGSPAMSGGGCSQPVQLPGLTAAMVTLYYPAANPETDNIATGFGQLDVVTVAISNYPLGDIAQILYPGLNLGIISATVPFVFF